MRDSKAIALAYLFVVGALSVFSAIEQRRRKQVLQDIRRNGEKLRQRLATHFPYRREVEHEALGTSPEAAMQQPYLDHITPEDDDE